MFYDGWNVAGASVRFRCSTVWRKKTWRREWDSLTPFVTNSLRSMRCRKPKSLPAVTFYHILNMSHTRNVD